MTQLDQVTRSDKEHPDYDHGNDQYQGDGSLKGQASLVSDIGPDLVVEFRPRLKLGQAGIATFPVFSVLSQTASAPRNSLMYAASVMAQSSGP